MKNNKNLPDSNIISSNEIRYSGKLPECITEDGCLDKNKLTYILALLLERYCASDILSTEITQIDLACLIESNPDINIPQDITIESLFDFYKSHFCSIYTSIESIETIIESAAGIRCSNDIAQVNENEEVVIDVIINDFLNDEEIPYVVTIEENPLNGIATVISNKVKYVPSTNFYGNDKIKYKVTKGAYTCTAYISIKVNQVITEQTIEDIVIENITTILSSDQYWDLSFNIGDKILISNSSLVNFDFSGSLTAGIGLSTGRYKNWAICNGNNGTEDLTEGTLRGFNHSNPDYNSSGKTGGNDNISFTLSRDNIPPHQHTAGHFGIEFGIQSFNNFNNNNFIPGLTDKQRDSVKIDTTGQNDGAGGGMDFFQYGYNTGDGTTNYNNNKILKSNPDAIELNIRNKYKTVIIIEKIK
ncbi:MAG: hypothetical protein KC414_06090 [Romboutsia sp.]|nr:hypothetical protein [Romboutsia sp.]